MKANRYRIAIVVLSIALLAISTDAEAEWTHLNSGVSDILYGVNFYNENIGSAVGWGASAGGVVVTTTDGGENWITTIPVYGSYLFTAEFTDSLTCYTGGCDAGGSFYALLVKTTNCWNDWTPSFFSDSYGLYVVDFPSATTGYACGWLGKIYKTTNGGDNWNSLPSGTGNVFRWMHFPSVDTGYAVCGTNFDNPKMLYKTTNGATWSYLHNFGSGVIGGIYFISPDTGIAVGTNGSEVIYKTTDGGANWEVKFTGVSSSIFQGVHFSGETGWAVGGQGRIFKSVNGGDSWELDATVSPPVTFLGVYQAGDAVYAVGTSGAIFKNDLTTDIDDNLNNVIPDGVSLMENYPNPFNVETVINYSLAENTDVKLEIYDLRGQRLEILVDEFQQAGYHSVKWNAADFASGMYFSKIQISDRTLTRKIILLK
ncbi:MAG: T9SS type A sorting domain-containing protein [candidate division Zixibacteria bacterium]|nr:T9SS type A sorting domain-containing protein [candidate division Zixibacteria bacterium]